MSDPGDRPLSVFGGQNPLSSPQGSLRSGAITTLRAGKRFLATLGYFWPVVIDKLGGITINASGSTNSAIVFHNTSVGSAEDVSIMQHPTDPGPELLIAPTNNTNNSMVFRVGSHNAHGSLVVSNVTLTGGGYSDFLAAATPSGVSVDNLTYIAEALILGRQKAGAPVDGDYQVPTNGMLVLNTSTNQVWLRSGGAWAAIGGGAANNISTPHMFDDFMTGPDPSTSAAVSVLGWTRSVTGTGSLTNGTGASGHPGTLWMTASGAGAGAVGLYSGVTVGALAGFVPAEMFDLTWVFSNATTDGNYLLKCGISDLTAVSAGLTSPTNGIYIEKLTGDTSFFGVCRSGGTQTRTAALGTVTSSAYVNIRIRRTDASTIAFSFNGGADVTLATNIPTGTVQPFIEMSNNSTANNKVVVLDLFDLTITGLTR